MTRAAGSAPPWTDRLRIGTSGYVFDDWVGPFYPKGLARSDFLAFYAREHPVVEVNATYYRIPPPRTMASMCARSPEGFRFVVKAHQDMTHQGSRDPGTYAAFHEALAPMIEAGKLDGVLLQFPFGVRNEEKHRGHLAFLRESLPGLPLWAEFRHESWNQDPVFDFLERLDMGYCAVDEPLLEGLMPPVCRRTSDLGYVRFHGRNAEHWWGGGDRRYDWEYRREELEEWMDKLRDLASATRTTYVFFNNCYMGRAIKGARLLRRILGLSGPLELDLE